MPYLLADDIGATQVVEHEAILLSELQIPGSGLRWSVSEGMGGNSPINRKSGSD